jgi:hypothetical protein
MVDVPAEHQEQNIILMAYNVRMNPSQALVESEDEVPVETEQLDNTWNVHRVEVVRMMISASLCCQNYCRMMHGLP